MVSAKLLSETSFRSFFISKYPVIPSRETLINGAQSEMTRSNMYPA